MKSFNYTVPVTVEIKNLTEDECKQLTQWKCSQYEVKQCDDAAIQCKYTHIDENGKRHRISCKKAREMLGEAEWLSGLSRAAFHWNSCRYIDYKYPDKGLVEFNCSSMFR